MLIFPAIDLCRGKSVRLYRGDYEKMTVYGEPLPFAADFLREGATHIHLVDLEGARDGGTPNLETILRIKRSTGLFCEVGGGVRSMEVVERYLDSGVDRVILGTAAVTDRALVESAVAKYGERIAVGVDVKDGVVAIRGWMEKSEHTALGFCREMRAIGVSTFVCTDISKDGAMGGANHALYRELSEIDGIRIVASGGVSSLDDVKKLAAAGLYGAIVGKAYYEGAVKLREAIGVAG